MFVNTSQYTIAKKTDYPDKDSMYFESYWKEMHDYCIHGYSVGGEWITGRHFWYLNFWPIRGLNPKTGRKEIIKPRFTQLDYERFEIIERMYREFKDCLWFKARQNGSSETVAGALVGYNFTFHPASQNLIISGEDKYSANTMRMVRRGLESLSDTEFYKRKNPDTKEYIQAQYNETWEDNTGKKIRKVGGTLSEVYARTALTNEQVASGLTPSLIIYEEAGTWKQGRLLDTKNYIEMSIYAEDVKTGWQVFISTTGEETDSIEDVEKMFYDPDKYNLLTFDNGEYEEELAGLKTAYFIPSWKFKIMDKDGNYLKQESIDKYQKERDVKKGDDLKSFIAGHCFTPSEGFSKTKGGFFSDNIVKMLNSRDTLIKTHREYRDLVRIGTTYWKLKDGREVEYLQSKDGNFTIWDVEEVVFKDDPEGVNYIIEEPYIDPVTKKTPSLIYKSGIDSYDRDNADTSSSKGSMDIMKGFISTNETADIPVAGITQRPERATMFYENTAKLNYWYNARTLIEYSNLLIFYWYETNGFEYMLRERPIIAISTYIKNSTVTNRYGVDPSLNPYLLVQLAEWLSVQENIDKIFDSVRIRALRKFKYGVNCDITISFMLMIAHYLEDKNAMIMYSGEKQTDDRDKDYIVYQRVHGNLVSARW